ncbi:hypothetical protein [Cobetia sp. 29-18-1]|uniref:hypothetical protein n=1 Tax=Cobetia sp. 29-18-1 TaxID=3040018 RepID=UPI00244D11F0|nr:hypothetical protein [Cobetia sp. 29-18-1]MDH2299705.1 hypothetical protein [Cobetia sp. 29-18-1]
MECVESIVASVVVSIVTGIFSGLVSGWFIMNYSEYKSLRDDALKYIGKIGYMQRDNKVLIYFPKDEGALLSLSSALIRKGHNGIANSINKVESGLGRYKVKAPDDLQDVCDFLNEVQKEIRLSRPNFHGLIFGRNVNFKEIWKKLIWI